MLSGIDVLDSLVCSYPPELQAKLENDIRLLLQRDRSYINSQVQMILSNYHCCNVLGSLEADLQEVLELRQQIDVVILENIGSSG